MSAPESTAVVPPQSPAPPAAAAVTPEHISALHRRLDEIESWLGEKFKQVVALLEKAAPIVEKAAAAAAPVLGAAAAPVVDALEKIVGCCGHGAAAHTQNDGCTAEGCKCSFTAAGARSAGAPGV